MVPPWLGISLVIVTLCGLMAGLRAYQSRSSPHPELVRKLLHVGAGSVALSFPWLFATTWPVLTVAGISVLALWGFRVCGCLRRLRGMLDGVGRASLGDIYFFLATAMLFVLSAGDTLLFAVPMLILTLADAAAALIGVRYGRLRYGTAEGAKTLEGSVAFLIVAFLSALVPLLLFTDTGRAEALVVAAILALAVTIIEAIARKGLDNLFVPLGAFLLLATLAERNIAALAGCLAVTLAVAVFALLWRMALSGRAPIDHARAMRPPKFGTPGQRKRSFSNGD